MAGSEKTAAGRVEIAQSVMTAAYLSRMFSSTGNILWKDPEKAADMAAKV